jgi:hypothetical protein
LLSIWLLQAVAVAALTTALAAEGEAYFKAMPVLHRGLHIL